MQAQPSVNLFGVILDEPVTTITDLFVAAMCFYAFYQIWKDPGRTKAQTHFAWYFLLLGVGTTFGGLFNHGFKYAFEDGYWKVPSWETSILAIYFLTRACVEYTRPAIRPLVSQMLSISMAIGAIVFSTLMLYQMTVIPVVAYTGVGMWAVVFPLQVFIYSRTRDEVSKWCLLALFSTMMAAVAFLGEIVIDKWFNHIDLSHVFMFLAVYWFYLAAKAAGKATQQPQH